METFTGRTSNFIWPLVKTHIEGIRKTELAHHEFKYPENSKEPITHTGQQYAIDDYRRARFENVTSKYVNTNHAINLIREDPIIVCDQRVVRSSGGDALGHPKVYLLKLIK